MAAQPALTVNEERAEQRDETMYRARLRDLAGTATTVTIVNVSPNGFMARCDDAMTIGGHVRVTLPVVGEFAAEVRWSLGGRVGCKLSQEVPPALYQFVVAAMRRA